MSEKQLFMCTEGSCACGKCNILENPTFANCAHMVIKRSKKNRKAGGRAKAFGHTLSGL